jgi:hypothetical protein
MLFNTVSVSSARNCIMKLKIFTDLELLKFGEPIELLIPFIGKFNEEDKPGKMMSSRFDQYILKGRNFLEFTDDIQDSDTALLPLYYNSARDVGHLEEAIQPFLDLVEKMEKKLIIFTGHDAPNCSISLKNAIIFNSAVNKSFQADNIFSYPHFFEDFITEYLGGKLVFREKKAVPIVGFCGYAPPLGLKFGKEKIISSAKLVANYLGFMGKFPSRASHSYRARAIIGLQKSRRIKKNFAVKSSFAFGPKGQLNTGTTKESDEFFRRNFVNNITESDYTLCVRGIGNNSIRFFESLCCGRVPIFVNTNCVLPFDHIIDWKRLCIWIEEKDIDNIDKIVYNFHNKISNEEFVSLQKKLRGIWEEYLSPLGFFKNLRLFLDEHPDQTLLSK